jgi:hypothetical protein
VPPLVPTDEELTTIQDEFDAFEEASAEAAEAAEAANELAEENESTC